MPLYTITLANAHLSVPRDEFFLALRHFGRKAGYGSITHDYARAERDGVGELTLILPNILSEAYVEALYQQGRLRDNNAKTSLTPRPLRKIKF